MLCWFKSKTESLEGRHTDGHNVKQTLTIIVIHHIKGATLERPVMNYSGKRALGRGGGAGGVLTEF